MFDKPGFIRLIATLLLALLVVVCVVGVATWGDIVPKPPPESGRAIVGVCGLAAVFGLWVLWKPQRA